MTTFYIVRHGETEWNAAGRLQGWLNSPLTEKGITNAQRLAARLKNIEFQGAIVSTSPRAIETANILLNNRGNIPLQKYEDLREMYMGDWEGRFIHEIESSPDRESYRLFTERPEEYIATHTESFEEVTRRAMAVLQKVCSIYDGNVLVVSHGVTIKCIVNDVLQRHIADLWSPPWVEGTSVTELTVENGKWQLGKIGCTDHFIKE